MMRVAWKGLATNKLRTFLMMLGIIVGIAALTVIMAVGEGTKSELARRANQMWSQAHITVFAIQPGAAFAPGHMAGVDGVPPTLTEADARAITEQIPNVATVAAAQAKRSVPLKYKAKSTDCMVFGVTPEWQTLRSFRMADGEALTQEDEASSTRVCVLGLSVVQALFGDEEPLGATIRIENTAFRVKGIAAAKGTSPMGGDMDNRVLIPLSTFSRRLYNVTSLTQVVIALKDPSQMRRSSAEIEALMMERHAISRPQDKDFSVTMAENLLKVAGSSSRTLTIFLSIVAAISLLVGGVVVMNIMLISVSERTKEIGIRRAVGASARDILAQFRAEALVITLSAGVCGAVLGIALSFALPLVTRMQTAFSWQALVLAVLFSTVIGLVFGIQPARRAAALSPVQALRSE
ncbi:MAG: ABC transporter permease [Armatimonadetes bacterium]|nr:ABC transporter permease [Armatimonadota bacterium]